MLKNFQLAAIIKRRGGSTFELLRVPLHRNLQDQLAESWSDLYHVFVDGIEEVSFDPGYTPEEYELFSLSNYDLPDVLAGTDSINAANLDPITKDEETFEQIRGVVAFARKGAREELVLFQNFSRSHVIRPGLFLLLQGNTFKGSEKPGLTLEQKLSAVYFPKQSKLLFKNFRTVNTFLPLTQYYEEASEKEIRDVLGHDRLAPEDANALAKGANQWFRKRFAMLRDSNVLDEFSPAQIKQRSQGYEVNVQIVNNKIVFPADKRQAKRLLQFLNEEVYRGPITETLYETNSKREAEQ